MELASLLPTEWATLRDGYDDGDEVTIGFHAFKIKEKMDETGVTCKRCCWATKPAVGRDSEPAVLEFDIHSIPLIRAGCLLL